MWQHLSLTVLQTEYRTERACELPEFLGSTFRGAFGRELHDVCCTEPDGPCSTCRRPERCAAGALFDTVEPILPVLGAALHVAPRGDERNGDGRMAATTIATAGPAGFDQPRPYILIPPSSQRGKFAAGEPIRFGLTLVGRAQAWYPWIVATMARLGERGIGVERQKLALVRIVAEAANGRQFAIDPVTRGIGTIVPEIKGPEIIAHAPPPSPEAIIGFVTPAHLKQKRQRLDRLDGPALFKRLMRRIGTLVESYCTIPAGTPQCDYRTLSALAEQVVVREQDVRLREWERISSRRGIKHPLSGLAGHALVTNIAEPLWPYLIIGQWVHVGKGASFGQGRYMLALEQPAAGAGSEPTARSQN
jgi:hypothetical protein